MSEVVTTAVFIHIFTHFLYVLTDRTPFRGVPQTAMGYYVLRGERPEKPENAAAIGFSDPPWGFTKRCWDGAREARPTAGEGVTHLREQRPTGMRSCPLALRLRMSSTTPSQCQTHGSLVSSIFNLPPTLLIEQRCRCHSIVLDRRPGESHQTGGKPWTIQLSEYTIRAVNCHGNELRKLPTAWVSGSCVATAGGATTDQRSLCSGDFFTPQLTSSTKNPPDEILGTKTQR